MLSDLKSNRRGGNNFCRVQATPLSELGEESETATPASTVAPEANGLRGKSP